VTSAQKIAYLRRVASDVPNEKDINKIVIVPEEMDMVSHNDAPNPILICGHAGMWEPGKHGGGVPEHAHQSFAVIAVAVASVVIGSDLAQVGLRLS
jgi:hypothetical protein